MTTSPPRHQSAHLAPGGCGRGWWAHGIEGAAVLGAPRSRLLAAPLRERAIGQSPLQAAGDAQQGTRGGCLMARGRHRLIDTARPPHVRDAPHRLRPCGAHVRLVGADGAGGHTGSRRPLRWAHLGHVSSQRRYASGRSASRPSKRPVMPSSVQGEVVSWPVYGTASSTRPGPHTCTTRRTVAAPPRPVPQSLHGVRTR